MESLDVVFIIRSICHPVTLYIVNKINYLKSGFGFMGFHVSIVCIAFQVAPHAQVDFDSRVNGIQEGTHILSDFKWTDGRTHK